MQEILKSILGVEDLEINTLQNRLQELLDIQVMDILNLVPDFVRLLLMAGPLIVLALGLYYFLAGPKEATYLAGYRFRWGMGSVQAWRFTQKLAGIVWIMAGLGMTVWTALRMTSMESLGMADMLWQAIGVLLIQALVLVVCCTVINIIVFARYDLRGNRRLSWRELMEG